MLRFFRKIRQNLLENGNIRKYFWYALGEVFLVVIGILIALQINNWNEQRKQYNLEDSYYCRLLEDIRQDSVQINRLIEESNARLAASNQMINYLQDPEVGSDAIMNSTFDAIALITFTFKPSVAAFEDLKSSGNLNIIRDDQLKSDIINYYSTIDGVVDVIDTNADAAVALFYEKENYQAIGWHQFNILDEALDEDLVDKEALDAGLYSMEEFRELQTSDAIFFTGANARILFLYETIIPEIDQMRKSLLIKCTN